MSQGRAIDENHLEMMQSFFPGGRAYIFVDGEQLRDNEGELIVFTYEALAQMMLWTAGTCFASINDACAWLQQSASPNPLLDIIKEHMKEHLKEVQMQQKVEDLFSDPKDPQ